MSRNRRSPNNYVEAVGLPYASYQTEYPAAREYAKLLFDQLIKYKQDCAFTSSGVSDLLNKSIGYFSKIESRKAFPSMETFFDFCAVCKIHPKDFFDVGYSNPCSFRELEDELKKLDPDQLKLISELVKNMNLHNSPYSSNLK